VERPLPSTKSADGKLHDVTVLDVPVVEAQIIYVMDRGQDRGGVAHPPNLSCPAAYALDFPEIPRI
jgi:hypothetical protein